MADSNLEEFTLAYETHLRQVRILATEKFGDVMKPIAYYMGQMSEMVRLQAGEADAELVKQQFNALMNFVEELCESVDNLARDAQNLSQIHLNSLNELIQRLKEVESKYE